MKKTVLLILLFVTSTSYAANINFIKQEDQHITIEIMGEDIPSDEYARLNCANAVYSFQKQLNEKNKVILNKSTCQKLDGPNNQYNAIIEFIN